MMRIFQKKCRKIMKSKEASGDSTMSESKIFMKNGNNVDTRK